MRIEDIIKQRNDLKNNLAERIPLIIERLGYDDLTEYFTVSAITDDMLTLSPTVGGYEFYCEPVTVVYEYNSFYGTVTINKNQLERFHSYISDIG